MWWGFPSPPCALLLQRQVDVGPLTPLITCVPVQYANVTVSDNVRHLAACHLPDIKCHTLQIREYVRVYMFCCTACISLANVCTCTPVAWLCGCVCLCAWPSLMGVRVQEGGATAGIHEYFNILATSQIAFCQAPVSPSANQEWKTKMEEKKSRLRK